MRDGRKLRVLDLFSGIGGFSLGLERTGGFETVWFCEESKFCRRVLRKHWPSVGIYTDVRLVGAHNVGQPIDIITAGFPCTDISSAGRRAGLQGQHSRLWTEVRRLVCELGPRYLLVENSPALCVRGLGQILGDLASLGYDAEWHCIPAAAFGAPHLRARLWLLAYSCRNGDGVSPQIICAGRLQSQHRIGWKTEPRFCRVVDGIADQVDRLRVLGNTVLPQIPEIIGRAILETEANDA